MFEGFLIWRINSFFCKISICSERGVSTFNSKFALVVLGIVLFILCMSALGIAIPNIDKKMSF